MIEEYGSKTSTNEFNEIALFYCLNVLIVDTSFYLFSEVAFLMGKQIQE